MQRLAVLPLDRESYRAFMRRHEAWLVERQTTWHELEVTQPIDELIECQHSRATFAREAMGDELSRRFDAELREVLLPHADRSGTVRFRVRTEVTSGRLRDRSAG